MSATYAAPQISIPAVSSEPSTRSKKLLWTGRILSGIAIAFLTMDATMKMFVTPEAVKGTQELGWQIGTVFGLGILQYVLLAIHLVPRTAILGAVLWTGYLGGAVATHVRVGNPLFSHILFPVYVAAFMWLGLYLRDQRLRGVLGATR